VVTLRAEPPASQQHSHYPGFSAAFNPGIAATETEIDSLKAGNGAGREEKSRPGAQQGT
jgi:hypothetical protein